MCRVPLLSVKVVGLEKLDIHQSYVFISNHQGPFDIFLIYGYLHRPFRWLMKKSLANIPVIGTACIKAGHILVDKSGPKAIYRTQQQAKEALQAGKQLHQGVSIVVFPEGSRTYTGHMAKFRRGPFQIAQQLELPIVPMTIDGSFQVLPRQKGFWFINHHQLTLTIHEPILYQKPSVSNDAHQHDDIDAVINESYRIIESSLPVDLQGYRQNPDQ